MNNKNKIIWITAILSVIVVLTIFSMGAFLLYSSHMKSKELQVKLKLEEEKTKQEIAKSQNQQQMAQVTTSQETKTPAVVKRRTNYEAELMDG